METATVAMTKNAALRWLFEHSPVNVRSYTELGNVFGWRRDKTWKVVQGWKHAGYVETETAPDTGRLVVSVAATAVPIFADDDASDDDADDGSPSEQGGSSPLPRVAAERPQRPIPPGGVGNEVAVGTVRAHVVQGGNAPGPGFDAVDAFRMASAPERILILIAAGLSGTAAYMSITGMVVMYPVEPTVIMVFGSLIELAKFFGFGVLAAGWRAYSFTSRWVAALLLMVAALINASGVYGKLIENHVGVAATRTAEFAARDAGEGAKLEVAAGRLADIDKRLKQIDDAIAEATRRGRTNGAMRLAEEKKRERAGLASEREKAVAALAGLKAGRSGLAAQHAADEATATPVRYAAALFEDFGLVKPGTDPERLMRWLSFMILLSGDPLALALMVTINSRTKRKARA